MASPYTPVTLLSSAGVSPPISLDPTAKMTSFTVSFAGSSGATIDLTVQAHVWQPGSAGAPGWVAVSSHFAAPFPDGVLMSVLSPIAGLRLSSSGWSGGTATLQALQSITA